MIRYHLLEYEVNNFWSLPYHDNGLVLATSESTPSPLITHQLCFMDYVEIIPFTMETREQPWLLC